MPTHAITHTITDTARGAIIDALDAWCEHCADMRASAQDSEDRAHYRAEEARARKALKLLDKPVKPSKPVAVLTEALVVIEAQCADEWHIFGNASGAINRTRAMLHRTARVALALAK